MRLIHVGGMKTADTAHDLNESRRWVKRFEVSRSLAYLVILLLVVGWHFPALGAHGADPGPVLTGNWIIEFTWTGQNIKVQFVAQESGQATFVALDPVSNQPISASPTAAIWSFGGQSTQIYVFNISGEVTLPTSGGAQQSGTLELTASASLSLLVTSLTGWGQFHPANSDSTRGSQDPTFNFTAAQMFSLQIIYPNSGGKMIRGQDVTIQWSVQSAIPLASQQILLSLDNGASFNVIAPSVDPDSRSYIWAVPQTLPKSKKALIKVAATDSNGNAADAVSSQTFRIK